MKQGRRGVMVVVRKEEKAQKRWNTVKRKTRRKVKEIV